MAPILPAIAILGTGNMGGAILGGLVQPGIDSAGLIATTASEASALALRKRGVSALSVAESPDANCLAVADADIIILGVKPHRIVELLIEIAPHVRPQAVIVSMAAGVTLATLARVWPGALMRSMPNTPSQVGQGVTGLSAGERVSAKQRADVRAVFDTVGAVIELDESGIDALSSLSGSGPAYVYFFIERFMEVALGYGFSSEDSKVMIQGTLRGAMELLEHSGAEPQMLRRAVTSPGGTTAAALSVFEAADITALIREATDAAIARAAELAAD